jgi:hypothetical protein
MGDIILENIEKNLFIQWVLKNKIDVTKYDGTDTQTLLKSSVIEVVGLEEKFNLFKH